MSAINDIAIDRSGHILISKTMRANAGITPGTMFIVQEGADQSLMLLPLIEEPPVTAKEGVLVVQSQATGSLCGIEKREREARLAELCESTGR